MAHRTNAAAAINAGFFEIAGNDFSNLKDITFYNDVWVSPTLTPYTITKKF
ncbi:hypothetical protein ACE5D9_05820 [Rickettsia sp. 2024-CO-Wats]|uniref:hypothetical protein n=1 Tax=unclassified Rickettsia TaxID=114295 RepID=UPI00370DCF22